MKIRHIFFFAAMAAAAIADDLPTVKRLVVEDMTAQELAETIIPFGVLVVNSDALHDLRIGNGVSTGGVQVLDIRALTAPPPEYNYPLNMRGHAINLNSRYSIGASGGAFYIRSHGDNVLSILTDYEPLGETGKTWYDKTNDVLVVTVTVDNTNTVPTILYTTDIINGPWVEVDFTLTVLDANTIEIRVAIPPEDEGGYVMVTAGMNPRAEFALPVEAPEIRADIFTLSGIAITSWPDGGGGISPETASNSFVAKAGDTMTGPLNFSEGIFLGGHSNIALGSSAIATTGGVAIGASANALIGRHSIAIGTSALARDGGIAIGLGANPSTEGAIGIGSYSKTSQRGVAIGAASDGGYHGIAVGYGANAKDTGSAVGYSALAQGAGVAVGYMANGRGSGVALGNAANAPTNRIAIGRAANSRDAAFGIAIGHEITNSVDNSAAIRGSLYLDGATGIYTRATFGAGEFIGNIVFDHSNTQIIFQCGGATWTNKP